MGTLRTKADRRWLGFILGLLAPVIGLFGINQFQFPQLSFIEFIRNANEFQTLGTWLKPSILLNLLVFFLFLNQNRIKGAQGVVFATIVYAAYIAYLTLAL